MTRWFKCFSPDHPSMKPIMDEYGFEGYGMACAVLSECALQGITQIDEKHLKRWLGIYPKRAEKLIKLFQTLLEDWLNFTQTFRKIGKTFEKIDQSLPNLSKSLTKVEASNVDRDRNEKVPLLKKEEKRVDKKEENNIDLFVLPDWLDRKTWDDFVEYRKKIKSPLTDRAKVLNIGQLSRLRDDGEDPIKIIETTIMNGWKAFYPSKKPPPVAQPVNEVWEGRTGGIVSL